MRLAEEERAKRRALAGKGKFVRLIFARLYSIWFSFVSNSVLLILAMRIATMLKTSFRLMIAYCRTVAVKTRMKVKRMMNGHALSRDSPMVLKMTMVKQFS